MKAKFSNNVFTAPRSRFIALAALLVSVVLPLAAQPTNDQCAGAIPLTLGAAYAEDISTATTTGDPSPTCQANFAHGVWFTYTPPANGTVTISTCGSGFDTVVQVYSGSCASLTAVVCNDDNGPSCSSNEASVSFSGTGGTTYRILAGGFSTYTGTLRILATLVNDQCAGAVPLASGIPVTLDTSTATSTGDPVPTCQPYGSNGVWFTYTPSGSGPVVVSTCGSTFDTVLEVFTGSCGALSTVACNDDMGVACSGNNASLSFNGVAGTTYRILAGGYWNARGTLQIVAQLLNDQCWGAIALSAGSTYTMNTADATSTGDPVPTCGPMSKGVWFTFTPASNGVAIVSTCGSDFDTLLQIRWGSNCVAAPMPGQCVDDSGPACMLDLDASVGFNATAGTTYRIFAGGLGSGSGNLSIVASLVAPRTLTVNSFPASGVSVSSWPPDAAGISGYTNTAFSRTYGNGSVVNLQAVFSDGFNVFQKWQLDGVDLTTSQDAFVTMGANHTATAVYGPPNDQCAGAVMLTNGVPFSMDNTTATDTGDPLVPCGPLQKGVWFRFTPATNEQVNLSTCGSSFDTIIQVFTGTCGTLKRVSYGCNDDLGPSCFGANASVVISGLAGTNYYILVGGYGGASGTLQITATSGLVNDGCQPAIPLFYGVPLTMTTINATSGSNEVTTCQTNFGKGVWFSFASPVTGPVPVSTCGSSFDTVLQVYSGTCGTLTPAVCADDNGPLCSGMNASLMLNAVAGTNYYILAGGWNSYSGNLTIMAGTSPVITPIHAGDLVQLIWSNYYWPGYVLQRFTNSAGVGAAGTWVDQLPNTFSPIYGTTNPPAFFRLVTP